MGVVSFPMQAFQREDCARSRGNPVHDQPLRERDIGAVAEDDTVRVLFLEYGEHDPRHHDQSVLLETAQIYWTLGGAKLRQARIVAPNQREGRNDVYLRGWSEYHGGTLPPTFEGEGHDSHQSIR